MKLITTQDRIRAVADEWRKMYSRMGPDWRLSGGRNPHDIQARLDALPPTATAADVVEIIGNTSWVKIECGECGELVPAVVEVGQDPEYESRTAWLCRDCAAAVLAAFESKEPTP